ncbi:PP2C family protein-serine/threonine phosphatase [Cellulomonas dongxiuzhuiae]|uniref:Serine/threonine-protein phosphatase n=1 Tax=Cellulomonas dongxiuzhuiae TaxID=2819979 RepID=A0ABX8GP72_9CELL|nr:PP2C family protein-serine/threonine phosphatase [Cellulomonas dongxiuzhuiae]MBO3093345.1 serine/threonine-protein phosphatase [Cellulomonas dongxiuzhuiae]QWC17623.1 serine/threonine-protein phosphatase [Cellulomonas dongxiuzhuiae]
MTTEPHWRLMRIAHLRTRQTVDELWLRYVALGGSAGVVDLEAFLAGEADLPEVERDRVALAVNDHLNTLAGAARAPYSRTVRPPEPSTGLPAALVAMLRGTHLAPPEALPAVLSAAGGHLGVGVVAYLADDATEMLVPVPGDGGASRPPLRIDGTLPGRAFRRLQIETTVSDDGQARLWVPVIDGVERLGVLDVMTREPAELTDPQLHRQCWWWAHQLGHLVSSTTAYGDFLESLRVSRPRSAQAELVWRLLPPLTAGTDRVLVAGRIEPTHDIGGDVFDYALSADRAQFAVVDAMGQDLRAGFAAAAAVSAYRSARRSGAGLFEQVEAVHDAIAEGFHGDVLATGVVADLDLTTGRLRYLVAGHPAPLLFREGKVVKSLAAGRRPVLGLDLRDMTVGEENLQPDDTVVLYTDGVTDARDQERQEFGVARLVDTLQRGAAEHLPLPEVVRRVSQAIRKHQHGVLQDDATLLLVQWTTEGQDALDPEPAAPYPEPL